MSIKLPPILYGFPLQRVPPPKFLGFTFFFPDLSGLTMTSDAILEKMVSASIFCMMAILWHCFWNLFYGSNIQSDWESIYYAYLRTMQILKEVVLIYKDKFPKFVVQVFCVFTLLHLLGSSVTKRDILNLPTIILSIFFSFRILSFLPYLYWD